MPSRDKVLLGTAGVVGSTVLAWRTLFPWIGEDIKFLRQSKEARAIIDKHIANGKMIVDLFEEDVLRTPRKPFIIFEDRFYTYELVNEQANRVASLASQWGLMIGDTVAIMIGNEPAFIWTYLGLQKLGIIVAFINYNIKKKALIHSLKSVDAKILILGKDDEILNAVDEIRDEISEIPVYVQGKNIKRPRDYLPWDELLLVALPVQCTKISRAGIHFGTTNCYIFTSGTTGLPKPVIVSQRKVLNYAGLLLVSGFKEGDIVYTTPPLYHSIAGGLGLMGTITAGGTIVLRRNFSARHFWEDVRKYDITYIQYVGEMIRYIVALPQHPLDGIHKVKAAVGNGLRQDIWHKFQMRFRVPKICELFGATEGTTSMMNLSNRVGACGRISPILNRFDLTPKYIIKVDPITGEPIRNKDGHCQQVNRGGSGLLITGIPLAMQHFKFYKGDVDMNEKKVIRNIFLDGDAYFNYGDLVRLDNDYFVYFKDRLGDTYRWKGENVSTFEVANVISGLDFIQDANVYGVHVPGTEGRAGMAALHLHEGFTISDRMLEDIYKHCSDNLPSYAQPVFLRFLKEMIITGTFKQRKVEFVNEGYDPSLIADPLYYKDDARKTYFPLTHEIYGHIGIKSKL
ncbi:hypothetical protein CHS0354_027609 [Potamilus streckersoni]|uniref:long-chain-fatty-acid--CoA ligase n=1 Tax=Potamilus streckersoni TaxID=2493646 RepID=A0AAE0S465_9BIVA|nr:hypothetical protein CHS0354_027609 [Potamilus streckersoni]